MLKREYMLGDLKLVLKLPDSGLYSFSPNNATGKSYLCDLIRKMNLKDIKAVTFIEENIIRQDTIKLALSANVIIFDRFDLYVTEELIDKIIELSNTKLIILDYKHKCDKIIGIYKIMNITLTEKEMRVY